MKKNKTILFLCIVVAFNCAASFAHPVTPTLIVERGLDSSMFGVALAAMMFTNFSFAPFWGKLCGYIPTKRIMFITALGYACGQAIFGSAQSEVMVVAGRMFAGVFCGGTFTSFTNYIININSDPQERAKYLTALATIQTVAGAVGYFVGGMLGLISVEAAFIAQVCTLAGCGVLFFILLEDDTPYKTVPSTPLSIKEANPFSAFASARNFMNPTLFSLFAIVAICGIGQNSFEQVFNYYIKDQLNLSSAYNGIFKAIIAVVSLAVNSTICMHLIRKTDINLTFLPVMLGSIVPLGLIMICTDMLIPFVACDVVFFALTAMRLPLCQNLIAIRTTPENSNQIMGFYQSMNSLGGIFGALFAGLIYDTNHMYPFILAFLSFVARGVISLKFVKDYKAGKTA